MKTRQAMRNHPDVDEHDEAQACKRWVGAGRKRHLAGLCVGALATIGVEAGELEQFFYAPLNGATVAELTAAPEFPEQPFVVTPVNWFNTGLEGLTNASFHYGSWLRGSPPS